MRKAAALAALLAASVAAGYLIEARRQRPLSFPERWVHTARQEGLL